jgi:glucokinase
LLDRAAGVVLAAANLPFSKFPLTAELSAALGAIPVILESDANCGALGELAFGAGRGAADMCYLTVSTGIGMGIIAGGELISGVSGHAGEIGHVPVVPGGRPCRCGNRGCLEAYASGWALTALGAELQARRAPGGGQVLAAGRAVTARDVVEAAEQGDPECAEIVGDAVELLTSAIQVVRRLLDPEAIVLGGGLMGSDYFFARISSSLLAQTRPAGLGGLLVRGMPGEDAVLLGGLRLLQLRLPKPDGTT